MITDAQDSGLNTCTVTAIMAKNIIDALPGWGPGVQTALSLTVGLSMMDVFNRIPKFHSSPHDQVINLITYM